MNNENNQSPVTEGKRDKETIYFRREKNNASKQN